MFGSLDFCDNAVAAVADTCTVTDGSDMPNWDGTQGGCDNAVAAVAATCVDDQGADVREREGEAEEGEQSRVFVQSQGTMVQ